MSTESPLPLSPNVQIIDGIECILYPTLCKFCGVGIEVGVAVGYDTVKDPFKLISMAACNRCADLRENRRKIAGDIDRCMARLVVLSPKEWESQVSDYRFTLTTLVNQFCRICADFNGRAEEVFDTEIVEQLLVVRQMRPDGRKITGREAMRAASSIIGQCWKLNKA